MSKITSTAMKDVPAVNYPSLSDGYYEVEAIRNKRVRKVKFLLFFFFPSWDFLFSFFIFYILEYNNHFSVQFFFCLMEFFLWQFYRVRWSIWSNGEYPFCFCSSCIP